MALSTQRASASLLSSESAPRWKYDAFLSFRGADTRKGFVSHLYHELQRHGITTFYDDRELEGGTSIRLELPRAIKESHTAIVVLSPNYASSKWCLDELTNIVQCMKAANSILPVFYDVKPSDVGNQRGSFAEAFAEHEKKFISTEDEKKVTQWKADLKQVSKLFGWHLKNFRCERELIEDIVKCVWRKVQATFTLLDSSERLVGTDSALEQLTLLLSPDVNDVRFIGMTGMGGIGKTTLAKLVFDKIFQHFEVHCFLANVREVCARDRTLVGLQKKLLFPILKEKIAEIWDEGCGSIFTKKCLCNKKVLLVLDDVDKLNQLEILAGHEGWFGMGSRIIITTRNERLFVQHGIATSYKVQGLNYCEALELFSLNAFGKDQPEEDFLELSGHFLKYAGGLPLVLKTLGSFLYTRGQDSWKSELDNLHKITKPTIFNSLKLSYDGLEEMEKRIFLDVACFHRGKCITEVIRILDSSFGISSSILIDLLIERSLVYNDYENKIGMHDLIQEMAWTIVSQESEDPGLRSRLWLPSDIFHVFTSNTGTRAIEAISLRLPEPKLEVRQWNCETFSKMHGLRFLEFDNLIISSCPKFLPCSLRVINWSFYPSKFLPASFHPCLLTELKMQSSKLVRLWGGKKDFPNLKYIDLTFSYKLISTPDFSGLPNVEKLYLWGCKNLVEMHPSIAVLKRLKVLCLHGCESIKNLPSKVEIDSLESFDLSYCKNVKKIPEFGEQMKNLSQLYLGGTVIEKIPPSIEHLVGLTELDLKSCKNLLNLPRAICNLKSLRCLNATGCLKLDRFPGDMDYLETLYLGTTMGVPLVGMKKLEYLEVDGTESNAEARDAWGLLRLFGLGKSPPDPCWGLVLSSLRRLCSLIELDLRDCNLCEGDIPDDIGCLSVLKKLYISGNNFVRLPQSIRCLSKLQSLRLERCKSLGELPHLPLSSKLHVNVDDCTSLKRLLDPSKLSSRFANLYDFTFSSLNCITLVQDEGWINTILSRILKFATQTEGPYPSYDKKFTQVVSPGREIPEWFSNQSVGHSVNVELPPPSCTNWLGIAFCVVFEDPKQNLANPAALICPYSLRQYDDFQIGILPCFPNVSSRRCKIGSLVSEHLWVFYLPSKLCQAEQISFTTFYDYEREPGFNAVKKCGARLVYEQDLEELNRTLKVLKRTHEYCDEAAPSGRGSGSFKHKEQIRKRQKEG